jgi:hypothetical protein
VFAIQRVSFMRGLLSAVVLSALATGGVPSVAQVPATYTVEPFTPSATITIQGSGVRLRAEPFATPQTQVLSSGSTGLTLNVVGLARLPDWNWYQVVLKNGQKAFIRSDLTSAPSRGATAALSAPALPPIPVIQTPTPVYQPPVYQPSVSQPSAPLPPVYPPPVSAQPAGPGDAPISLVPTSNLPALQPGSPVSSASDPSGLQSVPPG